MGRSAEEVNRPYFREAYRTGRHGWAAEAPSPYLLRFLKRLRRVVPGGRLLDLGCGEGRHAFAAAQLGFKVAGIDFEPRALRRARRQAAKKRVGEIRFRTADVFCLPFRDASFDILLDYGCLHHQRKSDWPAYRASILRVLKPHGYYLLSVFSLRFRLFRGSRRSWHIALGAYRRCFAWRDLLAFFGRDLEVVEIAEERGPGGGFWHALAMRRGQERPAFREE